jgi:hypothetical protein
MGQPRLAAAFIHSIDCKINCLKIVRGSFVNIAEPLPDRRKNWNASA